MYDIGATLYVFKPFIVWYFIEYSEASMAYKMNKTSHSITVIKISKSNLEAGVLYVTVLYLALFSVHMFIITEQPIPVQQWFVRQTF